MELHKHDQQWIKEQLNRIPMAQRKRAIEGYQRVFREAWDSEPVDHKKSNAARFAANSRLREFISKLLA